MFAIDENLEKKTVLGYAQTLHNRLPPTISDISNNSGGGNMVQISSMTASLYPTTEPS
jgi:hypothetical protein